MHEVFEIKPLLVAAAVGAVVLMFIESLNPNPSLVDAPTSVRNGALVGLAVQMTVRLVGVS